MSRIIVALLAGAFLLSGCGGSRPGDGAAASSGKILFMQLADIYELDVKSGNTSPLVQRSDRNAYLLDPVASPDNTMIAYVVQLPPRFVDGVNDLGYDLWIAKRDGSGPHAVFTHDAPNQVVRVPQWKDDSHILAVIQERGPQGGVTNNLDLIDIATGERTRIRDDVLAFGLSPDRKRIVYSHAVAPMGETMETSDLEGGSPSTLIDLGANLQPFGSPRFSPDGATIAFASADQTGAHADREYATTRGLGASSSVATDGLPEDIWTIPTRGGAPERVATLKEDLPTLAWRGDGKHIFVLGARAMYDIDLANGAVARIGFGTFHGQLAWSP